jgi:pyruvate dehydrogenase E2 component (dihydrolipoamide acetyltransferase)
MNGVWTPDAVRSFTSVDVGVAIASPRGLVTPVLRSVDRSGIAAIAAATSDMVERAGSGRLAPRELEGGTTTVTNLGMFGVQSFAAIINPPQSSILAVGAVHRAPVVKKGKLAVGSVMEVTLSVDHRAVDGSTAAEWMRAFVTTIQHPTQILL